MSWVTVALALILTPRAPALAEMEVLALSASDVLENLLW